MNELIKKLRTEAVEYTNTKKPLGLTMWESVCNQKFAELIVKECAKICRDGIVTDSVWDRSYWDHACENRATAIQKHFGVEE